MRIEDLSGTFSQEELTELENFVVNELHSTPTDIQFLDVIRINNGPIDYLGRWGGILEFDERLEELREVSLFIDLNSYYLKTIDQLKKTLAHEYGHHWTLLYYALNYGLRVDEEKLPYEYYEIRGLNYDDFYHDDSHGWERCDKEIIAEDYRILLSPFPYNQQHDFETLIPNFVPPIREVENYIINLENSFVA